VELRKDMWELVRSLRADGVTVILTTHYIEEAEEMADRIGIINHGQIILVEEKKALMRKLGKKQLTLQLPEPLAQIPEQLAGYGLELSEDRKALTYTYDIQQQTDIAAMLADLHKGGIRFQDLSTRQSSLEDIFVGLLREKP